MAYLADANGGKKVGKREINEKKIIKLDTQGEEGPIGYLFVFREMFSYSLRGAFSEKVRVGWDVIATCCDCGLVWKFIFSASIY